MFLKDRLPEEKNRRSRLEDRSTQPVSNGKKLRVLVIGQTPPPYHGQAVMIQQLVEADLPSVEILHLRMSFSENIQMVGRFSVKKLFRLFSLYFRALAVLIQRKADILYYPPAGPGWIPILRDMLLLPPLRIFAPRVIYHFRAGGISEFLNASPRLLKAIAKLAYGRPDSAIALSRFNPPDAEFFQSKRIFVVPNGLRDRFVPNGDRSSSASAALLYIGMLSESKGLLVLLDAFRRLVSEGFDVTLKLAGEFESESFRKKYESVLSENGLRSKVQWMGLVTGEEKWKLLGESDVLCFLSHYPAETFGNVVLEAMMCGLPVVATRWRGIQDLVVEGVTGFLVSVHDAGAAAERLGKLVLDPELRKYLGANGRDLFLRNFTLERHLKMMENVFLETAGVKSAR